MSVTMRTMIVRVCELNEPENGIIVTKRGLAIFNVPLGMDPDFLTSYIA